MNFIPECWCNELTKCVTFIIYFDTHSKNTRVKRDPERVHWGQTPFRVKDDPEIGQLSADVTNNGVRLTQLWVIFRVRLTDIRVIVDPEWSLAPMDPFWVKFDPSVFRVQILNLARGRQSTCKEARVG